MKKRIAALLLAALVCGGAFAGCAKPEETRVMWVAQTDVMPDAFETYLDWAKYRILSDYGIDYNQVKDQPISGESGQTTAEAVRSAAETQALRDALVNVIYDEQGLSYDADAKADAAEIYDSYAAGYESKSAFKSALKKYGLSEKEFKGICEQQARENQAAEALYEANKTEYEEQNLRIELVANYGRVKQISISKYDADGNALTGDALEAAKAKYEEALGKAQAGEDFDALVEQYSESRITEEQKTFGTIFRWSDLQSEELRSLFADAQVGQIVSGELTDSFYIAQVLTNDDDAVFEQYRDTARQSIAEKLLDQELSKRVGNTPYYYYEDRIDALMK